MKEKQKIKEKILDALEDKPEGAITFSEEARKLSNKKLKEEIEGIEWHISNSSYGMWELKWREALYQEADRRKLEL